jgi:hypothetical protein
VSRVVPLDHGAVDLGQQISPASTDQFGDLGTAIRDINHGSPPLMI